MTKQDQVNEAARANKRLEITRLRHFGHGFKFTVQTFRPDGRADRTLACVTSAEGKGLIVGGITVSERLEWQGLTLLEAHSNLTRLFEDHPEWTANREMRRATV